MRIPPAPVLALALTLAACGLNVQTRGALKEADWKQKIVPNQTTEDEVKDLLGSPSARSSFGPEVWYYITTKRETVAFLKPEVTDDEVVGISFNPDNTVKAVEDIGKDKARDIEFSQRETPTEGHSMSFIEQLLGNVGRFNAPGGMPGQEGTVTSGGGGGTIPGR